MNDYSLWFRVYNIIIIVIIMSGRKDWKSETLKYFSIHAVAAHIPSRTHVHIAERAYMHASHSIFFSVFFFHFLFICFCQPLHIDRLLLPDSYTHTNPNYMRAKIYTVSMRAARHCVEHNETHLYFLEVRGFG